MKSIKRIYERKRIAWAVTKTGAVYEIWTGRNKKFSGEITKDTMFSYDDREKKKLIRDFGNKVSPLDVIDYLAKSYGFILIKEF